jgi:hypothetical protein
MQEKNEAFILYASADYFRYEKHTGNQKLFSSTTPTELKNAVVQKKIFSPPI